MWFGHTSPASVRLTWHDVGETTLNCGADSHLWKPLPTPPPPPSCFPPSPGSGGAAGSTVEPPGAGFDLVHPVGCLERTFWISRLWRRGKDGWGSGDKPVLFLKKNKNTKTPAPSVYPLCHGGRRKHSWNGQSLFLGRHTSLPTSAALRPGLSSPPLPAVDRCGCEAGVCTWVPLLGGEGRALEAPSWALTQMNRPEGEANASSPHCHPRASD